MPLQENLTAELIEKELVDVDLVEKEIASINLKSVDILSYYKKYIQSNLVKEEAIAVNPLPSKRFKTSKLFVTDNLSVYLNGLNEYHIVIIDNMTFEFKIDIIDTDIVHVEYIEKI